jgi:hypothetical protein
MKRELANSLAGFALLCLLGPMPLLQARQQIGVTQDNNILEHHVDGVDLEYISTVQAFSKALLQASVPGGIVRMSSCAGDVVIHKWQPLGSSLRNVLDSIEKADPQYRWSMANEVINALPVAGEPALLKTRIGEFKVKKVALASMALSKLMATPEVRDALSHLHLNEALKAGSFPLPDKARKERTVQCGDVTLREALNAIALAFGNAVWFYREDHCNGKDEYSIDFIVE